MATTTDINKQILELREKTGAGMLDCKKALVETGGDFEAALTALRKKGLADAAKKSTRLTKEGLVAFHVSGKAGAIIELNCETDFVARVDHFQNLGRALAQKFAEGGLKSLEEAKPLVQPVFEKLGENMGLRRFERFELKGEGLIAGYVHLGAKKGALIELSAGSAQAAKSPEVAELAKELLLQIVGFSPKYLERSQVPQAEIDKEKEIHAELLRKEGKPEASIPKIIEGKINKLFYQQWCLLDQMSVRDNKTPVSAMIAQASSKVSAPLKVERFALYQLGQ